MSYKSFDYLQKFNEVNEELERLDKEYRIEFNFTYVREKKTPCVIIKSLCSDENGTTASPIIYNFDWMDGDVFYIIAYFDSIYYDSMISVDMDNLRTKKYLQENLVPILVSADYVQDFEANDILYTPVEGTDMVIRYGIFTNDAMSGLDGRSESLVGTLRVTEGFFESLEVENKEELYKMALENAGKEVNIYTLSEHMARNYWPDVLFSIAESRKEDFWVVTNKKLCNGAASIISEKAKETLENVLGNRYLVCVVNADYCVCAKWDGDVDAAEFLLGLIKDKEDFVSHNLYIMENKEIHMYVSK